MARKTENADLTVEVKVEEVSPVEEAPVLSERTKAEMEGGRAALATHAASLVSE
jgi:hypothetical protein